MSQDWWWGVIIGGLAMTFVWGCAVLVIIAGIGTTRHQTPMDGRQYTGDGSDTDDR